MGNSGATKTVDAGDGPRGYVAVCAGATLLLSGESLQVAWADGGQLALPVAWCRTAEAQRVEEDPGAGVQIVLRFAPPRPAGATGMEGLIAVRLSVERDQTLDVHEFLEMLRILAGLKVAHPAAAPCGEKARADAAGAEENTFTDAVAASGPRPPLQPGGRRAPLSHPDWLVFQSADDAEALYEEVQRQLSINSMNGEG